MRIKLLARLVTAVSFALIAFIFTEVVPDVPPLGRNFLRIVITVWAGLMGFGIFPDLAKKVTLTTVSLVNYLTSRVSSEVINQMMKLTSHQNQYQIPLGHHAPLGGVTSNQPIILDTSAIIDGRILDIAKTRFLYGTVLIPNFVLTELQQVADSSDFLKRQRGRLGFEVIENLKKIKGLRVDIWDKDVVAKTVDERIVKLTKSLHGKLITTDYNLNKVASLSNILVLNINDLANAVKVVAVPGEQIQVKVIHIGKDPKQGVAYLADGTMIVVEDGADLMGKEIKVEVTRILQVPAGRMIFSKKI